MIVFVLFIFALTTVACDAPDDKAHGHKSGSDKHGEHESDIHDDHKSAASEKGTKAHGDERGRPRVAEKPHGADHQDDDSMPIVKLTDVLAAKVGVKTTAVEERALPHELATTGEVDFDREKVAHVNPRLAGRVVDSLKSLGDDVSRGDWLVTLESIEIGKAKAAYLKAKAVLGVAEKNLKREQALRKDNISSERDVLEAEGKFLVAKADADAAQETLRIFGLREQEIKGLNFGDRSSAVYAVKSPIAGRVVQKHVTKGELVDEGAALFTIADLSSVWVWIDLFARDLPLVHVGDDVAVVADAVPGKTFVGKIGYIRDEVDKDTRAVRARIDVKNEKLKLKPGMYASVRIADPHDEGGAKPASKGLAIPVSAVVRHHGRDGVFVRTKPGVFELHQVRLGRRSAAFVEVRGGLNVGEAVASSGTFFLISEVRKESLGEDGHAH